MVFSCKVIIISSFDVIISILLGVKRVKKGTERKESRIRGVEIDGMKDTRGKNREGRNKG